ncbi:hypothetical protein ALC56_08324, partial [Trachymyrmex septentrionalis]
LAQLRLYSTTSLDALVRTTGAAWENGGGKAEVDARSCRELATRREREAQRGDKEKEGKTNEMAREKRRSPRLGVDSPIDPPPSPLRTPSLCTSGPTRPPRTLHHCSRLWSD